MWLLLLIAALVVAWGALALMRTRARAVQHAARARVAAALLSLAGASVFVGLLFAARAAFGRGDVLDQLAPLRVAIVPTAVAFALYLLLLAVVLRRAVLQRGVLLEALLLGSTGFVLCGYAFAREADMALDTAPASSLRLALEPSDLHITRAKGQARYWLYPDGRNWPEEILRPRRIEIDGDTLNALRGADSVVLIIKPGALGIPWVDQIRRGVPQQD